VISHSTKILYFYTNSSGVKKRPTKNSIDLSTKSFSPTKT